VTVSDHDPATGLTRDSHRVRRASTLLLLLGAPEGGCLSRVSPTFHPRPSSRRRLTAVISLGLEGDGRWVVWAEKL
jgi:hypothetical protein